MKTPINPVMRPPIRNEMRFGARCAKSLAGLTTLAAMFGGLPLALGRGTGSELRHPLGVTIVGGLLLSQVLTLYTTPVIYLYFDRLARRFEKLRIGNRIPEAVPGD